MFIFYFSFLTILFTGEWNQGNETQIQIGKYKSQKFRFNLTSLYIFNEYTLYSANLSLYGIKDKNYSQDLRHLHFQGISFINKSTIFLIKSIPDQILNTPKKSSIVISQILKENNITSFQNDSLILNHLLNELQPFYSNLTIISLTINIAQNTNYTLNNFDLPISIDGILKFNQKKSFYIFGQLFNAKKFIVEGKIYGVITSFYILISFYSWITLNRQFRSNTSLVQLSHLSCIFHIAFDFAYAFFVFNFSEYNPPCSTLYNFLFLTMLIIYFQSQMKELSLIWKANNPDIVDFGPNEIRKAFVFFFFQMIISIFAFLISSSLVFRYPFICCFVLYSFFIPQIIHHVQKPIQTTSDVLFSSLITFHRLIPAWYFTMYQNNITFTHSPKVFIFILVYSLLQLLIIILQNIFGGDFFLPYRYQGRPYNYHSSFNPGDQCAICMCTLNINDEVMVTPCNHAFHQECLQRWMEEQLVCPICRSSLPLD